MNRYYDPQIFQQTLDGVDLDNHVIASYYLKDRLEGEKFLDHFALIQAMALEGSTGTWEKRIPKKFGLPCRARWWATTKYRVLTRARSQLWYSWLFRYAPGATTSP